MTLSQRVLSGLVTVATIFFVFWLTAGLLSLVLPTTAASWVAIVAAAACGRLARRQMLRRPTPDSPPGIGWAMGKGALILGAIGFVAGFFGPMIFTPGANQGPMLGIFITGPGGVLLGAVAGAIWWIVKERPTRRDS